MYKGKNIKQLKQKRLKKSIQYLKKQKIDLNNPPNPYERMREAQKKQKQNRLTKNPYQWVRTTTQNQLELDNNPNNTNTISRVEISSQNYHREYQTNFNNQNDYNNHSNYNNENSNSFRPRHNIQQTQFQNQKRALLESIFEQENYQFQEKPDQFKQAEFQFESTENQYYDSEAPDYLNQFKANNHSVAKDIFKKDNSKKDQVKKNQFKQNNFKIGNETLCNLKQCQKQKKLVTIKILSSSSPLVTQNYKMGDVKMWQISREIQDYSLYEALKKFPHIKTFKNNQKAIIKCALTGNDVFTCIPTGGGKSLIFQILTFIKKGIYLCILPLVSLIYDQEMQARKFGIQVYSLTGAAELKQIKQIYNKLNNYSLSEDKSILILCTPEKIGLSQQFIEVLKNLYYRKLLQHVIIDEVHCVATWGKEFRKEYENLSEIKVLFPNTPILALTATVTEKIKQDIINRLKIKNCYFFQSSFNRPNLFYEVRPKSKKSFIDDISVILQEYKKESGIIYCLSKKDCEQTSKKLNNIGYSTAFYHADVTDKNKKNVQDMWMKDKIKIIIATIAFGMGINKPDVRFVIHYSLSKSLQNYYQQSGRAGRDGKPAKCILYYQRSDRQALQSMNLKNEYSDAASKMFSNQQLAHMVKYCEQKFLCRRKFQLMYLGQKDFDPQMCKKTCDNCIQERKFKEFECIEHAKEIVRYVQIMQQKQSYISKAQLVAALKNKNTKTGKKFQYDRMQNLHVMFKFWKDDQLQELILELLSQEILKQIVRTTKVPKIGKVANIYIECNYINSNRFLDRVQTLPMRRQVRDQLHQQKESQSSNPNSTFNFLEQLFNELEQEQKPAELQIFNDFQVDNYGEIDFGVYEYNQSYQQRLEQVKEENNQYKQQQKYEKEGEMKKQNNFDNFVGQLYQYWNEDDDNDDDEYKQIDI